MIELYNTLTRKKEVFKPLSAGKVKMYVCGPTTYNFIHLGNARPLVVFDTIRRYLEYKGYEVYYVQNFTDIDDKIIDKAREEGVEAGVLAEKYITEYFKDADALNVRRADKHPKVSEHLDDIIRAIEGLIDKGYAYVVDGNVFFRVRQFKEYGKLSKRSMEELKAGARVEVDQRKEDPLDFALWKKASAGEPSWESPWGYGRPGWHIECSVMSSKYLGVPFDIHGGGADLIFPHHENEIAQAEALSGKPFSNYWLHNGFITVNKEKMSKSLGNFFLVREILKKYAGDVIRFFLLSTHYRSPLDFDDGKLEVSKKSLDRIKNTQILINKTLELKPKKEYGDAARRILSVVDGMVSSFETAMDDDFNTSLALAAVFDFCKDINVIINEGSFIPTEEVLESLERAKLTFEKLAGNVLGILYDDTSGESGELVDKLVKLFIEVRQEARQRKDWNTADKIRDKLKEIGIILEDTPQGTRWKMS